MNPKEATAELRMRSNEIARLITFNPPGAGITFGVARNTMDG
jgi:hypothetical protein